MMRDEPPESKTRWLLRFVKLGIGACAGAVAVALLIDLTLDPAWPWSRTAIVLLGASVAVLVVAATSAGSGSPTAMNYDRYSAFIEVTGKQMTGAPQYQPSQAGLDALFAILPPFLTAVALLVMYGF